MEVLNLDKQSVIAQQALLKAEKIKAGNFNCVSFLTLLLLSISVISFFYIFNPINFSEEVH
jgi:hypothetical protein